MQFAHRHSSAALGEGVLMQQTSAMESETVHSLWLGITPMNKAAVSDAPNFWCSFSVADTHGPKFWSISCSLLEYVAKLYIGAPPWTVGTPTHGESWIRPGFWQFMSHIFCAAQ